MILENANNCISDTKPFEQTMLTFAVRAGRGYRLILTCLQPARASD